MSDENIKIYIVDDDPAARMIIADEFEGTGYSIHEFETGQACIDAIGDKPDIVLMDVEMPGLDGYETCKKIKEQPDSQDIDVIFISSHDDVDEKLKGYDAGGSDYLIKPVLPKELDQKIQLSIKNRDERKQSAEGQKMAFETAMTAMTSAGEQGIVLDFLRNSFSVKDIEELMIMVVDYVSRYELECTVQVRADFDLMNHGTKEPVPPIESELLQRLKDGDRISTHGKRGIFTFGDISLLVKNYPDDEDKTGRLRDHLAILMEGAENKLKQLLHEVKLKKLIFDANSIIGVVSEEHVAHKKEGQKIMDDMLVDVEESFLSWGLNEEQEQRLIGIVQNGVEKSLVHADKGEKIDEKMKIIYQRLKSLQNSE